MSKTYNLAFCTVVFLDHLHVRVIGKAVLTDGWKVSGLPTGAVEVVLDLWCSHGVCGEQRLAISIEVDTAGGGVCGWSTT